MKTLSCKIYNPLTVAVHKRSHTETNLRVYLSIFDPIMDARN